MASLKQSIFLADDMSSTTRNGRLRFQVQKNCADFLAALLGIPIEVVHVEEPDELPYSDLARLSLVKKPRRAQKQGDPAQYHFLIGDPAEQILNVTRNAGFGKLVVLGTHGRRGIKRLLLGSVAEEVIRNARVPVLTVGPVAQARGFAFKTSCRLRLIVATDLGQNSGKAEAYALRLAKKLKAEVVLVHCFFQTFHPILQAAFVAPGGGSALAPLLARMQANAKRLLAQRCKKFDAAGVPCRAILSERFSSAAEVILEAAVFGRSMIIMGTHARRSLTHAFLGSTAREVILTSPVPVITVASRL